MNWLPLLLIVGALTGCAAAVSNPNTQHGGDRRTIFDHAEEYWSQARSTSDPASIEADELEQYAIVYEQGRQRAIAEITEKCQTVQEFTVDGITYGCMALRLP